MQEQPARCRNHECINVDIRESGLMIVIARSANPAASKPTKGTRPYWRHGLKVAAACLTILIDKKPKKTKTFKATQHVPGLNQICVANLLCAAFVNVKEKSWRWYLLRRVAVCLEPYANLPAIEFGPLLFGQVVETMATTPMQATRNGDTSGWPVLRWLNALGTGRTSDVGAS